MSILKLSTELKFIIIGYLELQSLINLRQTCRILRDIIDDASKLEKVLLPARAKLLSLFLDLHKYESFVESRKHVWKSLNLFDRKSFLSDLATKLQAAGNERRIPPEFETWILEWPERAVIGWVWPGLDNNFDVDAGTRGRMCAWPERQHEEAPWWKRYGANSLCWPHEDEPKFPMYCSDVGFSVEEHGSGLETWVYMGAAERWYGKVCHGCYERDLKDIMEEDAELTRSWGKWKKDWVTEDWVSWQRMQVDIIEYQYRAGESRAGH